VRDLIRGIQSLRKDSGFEVTDRINVKAEGPQEVRLAASSFIDYLCGETLTESFKWTDFTDIEDAGEISVGDFNVRIIIEKK